MTRRTTRRVTALLSVPLLALLAGCTPLGQFLGPGEGGVVSVPTPSESPAATEAPTPEPTSGDCDDVQLTQPGEYHLPDCLKVTVDGQDIEVNAGDIETLIVLGNANDVDAGNVGTLKVVGNVNDVDTLDAGSADVTGNFNEIGVHGSVDRVAIDGDDNEVLADGEVGAVEDRGERNTVGSTP